jgi:hypothetical protein
MLAAIAITLLLSAVEYRCVRWAWTGDVFNRKVYCLEWKRVQRK